MITIRSNKLTIAHEELLGSPREDVSDDLGGVRVTRKLRCSWPYRHTLGRDLLGWREIFGGNVIEHLPHNWPAINEYLIATSVSIEPFSPKMKAVLTNNRFAEYDSAILTVTYTIPQIMESEAYGGNVQIRETFTGASEFITLPKKNLFWGKGAAKEAITDFDAPGKTSEITEWTYNVSGARIIPPEVNAHPGKINAYTCISVSTGRVFLPETLLCGTPAMDRLQRFDSVTFDLTLRFLYKNNGTLTAPKGWNHFPRVSASGVSTTWERITDGTVDRDMYDLVDFGVFIV